MLKKTLKNIDPVKFFQKLSKKEKNKCFLYSKTKNGFEKTIAWNPKEKFSYKNSKKEQPEEKLEKFIEKNKEKGRKIIGYISYDIGYTLHEIKKTAKDDLLLPDIFFLAFENWLTFEEKTATLNHKNKKTIKEVEEIKKREIPSPSKNSNNKNFKIKTSKEQYEKAFHKIKDYIKEGDIYQINLTHRLEAKTKIPPQELFTKIIKSNNVDFFAYIEGENFEILSASPERFIRTKGENIKTCPIKGTKPRGKTKKEDEKLKKDLIESEKEKAELNMITDLLRNDLGKICKIGSVKVEKNRVVKKYPTIWHTHSEITGKIRKDISIERGLLSMLPGGSITGCPKKRAMEIIDELEPKTRSIYTGTIGYINPNGDIDFNIAIRTIIKKNDKLYLQVGGGIVIDSNKDSEFEETLQKAKSFMKILC